MKRVLILLFLVIFIIGCTKQEIIEEAGKESKEIEPIKEEETETQIVPKEETKKETSEEKEQVKLPEKKWRTETADDDGWVGIDSSIAVDANGNPYISHFDAKKKI